jgi:hypothetical protein
MDDNYDASSVNLQFLRKLWSRYDSDESVDAFRELRNLLTSGDSSTVGASRELRNLILHLGLPIDRDDVCRELRKL